MPFSCELRPARLHGVLTSSIRRYAGAYAKFRPESEQNCSHTPPGVGMARKPPLWLKPGDVVEVEISRIGVLRNSVVAETV